MFKYIISLLLLNFSFLFATPPVIQMGPPPRPDKLDYQSQYANQQLSRAKQILRTLVSDPQNYQLILSDNPHFGGEAVPAHAYSEKPGVIIYQGALGPNVTKEELAFMIAHELGHVNLHHMEKFDQRMDKIMLGPPMGISGTTFCVFAQKLDERQADLFGYNLYKKAGYDMSFFPKTFSYISLHHGLDRHAPTTMHLVSSLSMQDSHFSMKERFQLLASKTT